MDEETMETEKGTVDEETIETNEKVTRVEDILNDVSTATDPSPPSTESKKVKVKKEKSLEQLIPKGKPKSGRIWKEQKTRFSSIIKTRGIRLSFEKKKKMKEDLKRAKEMTREIKARKQAEKETKKARRRANLKRAEENNKKGEIVQVITNTAKLKKIKRKHLRMIQKRDTLNF